MSNKKHNPETKLCDLVYDGIFSMIASGELAENIRLPSEVNLSRHFGVSRPVVREALAQLRDDGLIQSRRGSGSYVQRKPDANVFRFVEIGSVSDIQRCYDFRVGFEAGAAGLAATSWRAQEMEELESAAEELSKALSKGELAVEADSRFHRAVAAATRNPYYISVQESLDQNIRFGMNLALNLSLLKPAARNRIVLMEHAEIIEAIRQRDPTEATRTMVRHIENARKRMFEGHENT